MEDRMRRKILLPLDGSSFAEAAAPYAVSIAEKSGAEVTIALVHPSLPAVTEQSHTELIEWARRGEQGYMDEAAERLFKGTDISVSSTLLTGDPPRALVQHAADERVDLVVMATQGWGPASRLWIGSVADRMVRELTLPLLLVRPNGEGKGPKAAADAVIRRIILPLDRSRFSEGSLEGAALLAEIFSAEIIPLYVLEVPLEIDRPTFQLLLTEDKRATMGLEADVAATYLKNIVSDLRVRGVNVGSPEVVRGGDVATTILEQTESLEADAIAIATHGEKGVKLLTLGSVTDKVIRGATVPVLVCRPQG